MARQRAKSKLTEQQEAPDTRERILLAAEQLLRQYGPAKTTVLDVARRLEMSHANVYRHFASKAELQDAVAARWLARISSPLALIAARNASAADRLREWNLALHQAKRKKVLDDPEMFATYHQLTDSARVVVDQHLKELHDQVELILTDGVKRKEFHIRNISEATTTVLNATIIFHHPHFLSERTGAAVQKQLQNTLAVLIAGLKAGVV